MRLPWQGQAQLTRTEITQFAQQYRALIEIGLHLNPQNPPLAHSRGRPKQTLPEICWSG